MTNARLAAVAALLTLAVPALATATTTPKPSGSPHAAPLPQPHLPIHPLHAEYNVEVNKKGQVVKIVSGVGTKDPTFNTLTFGNALQMWIRRPDGTAIVGLFKVTYDYNPKTHKITRIPTLIKAGGNWADSPGAATAMIETAQKEAQARWEAEQKEEAKERAALPPLNSITGSPTPKPSPVPTL